MQILINNKNQELAEAMTLTAMLHQHMALSVQGIAIAVNNTVVPKTDWDKHRLKENDSVIIIRATQGG